MPPPERQAEGAGHWPTLEETEAEDGPAGRIDEAEVARRRDALHAEIREGLDAAEQGETVDLGSFGKYLED